ncbi:MAG TPA: ABC transporter permease [Lactobacillaceae bacterium]|jgi:putative ABC transport system permease protein
MMTKLAFATLKYRRKDFVVLFTGLLVAVAIFAMFSTLAHNEAFLKGNTPLGMIVFIFYFGQVLLGGMTLVYLNFANRFLLQLRQREYGLLMMLGATKGQVGQLLLRETLLIGGVSLVFGSLIGVGLSWLAGQILTQLLHTPLSNWQIINGDGLLVTVIFFVGVFLLSGLWNSWRLHRTNVQQLLVADEQAEALPKFTPLQAILGVAGIVILVASFYVLASVKHTGMFGLVTATILNVLGTYWVTSAALTLILTRLQRLNASYHGLRRFTLGQLLFRLAAFKRILTIVTVMFALALGALSVGRGFQLVIPLYTNSQAAYTLSLHEPTAKDARRVAELTGKVTSQTYHYKINEQGLVSWRASEFDAQPLPVVQGDPQTILASGHPERYHRTVTSAGLAKQDRYLHDFSWQTALNYDKKAQVAYLNKVREPQLLTDKKFSKITGRTRTIQLLEVVDVDANRAVLDKISAAQAQRLGVKTMDLDGAYPFQSLLTTLYGGLEFLGFFLAIAFLMMLASTLMFKVLSNVALDARRYHILTMIGASRGQRQRALLLEIGVIFATPLILGGLDVYFGLPVFKEFLPNPYLGLPSAVVVIGGLYVAYYVLTVWLYQRLLRQAQRQN